jgi:hypothetical protein
MTSPAKTLRFCGIVQVASFQSKWEIALWSIPSAVLMLNVMDAFGRPFFPRG